MFNLLTLKYWLNPMPPFFSGWRLSAYLFFLFALLLSLLVFLVLRKKKLIGRKIQASLSALAIGNLIFFSAYLFLNYEQIIWMSSRVMVATWLIIDAVWIYFIVRRFKRYREKAMVVENDRQKEIKRYIP
jgi:hypothetical protein